MRTRAPSSDMTGYWATFPGYDILARRYGVRHAPEAPSSDKAGSRATCAVGSLWSLTVYTVVYTVHQTSRAPGVRAPRVPSSRVAGKDTATLSTIVLH